MDRTSARQIVSEGFLKRTPAAQTAALAVCILFTFVSVCAGAHPGDLDASFGNGGVLIAQIGISHSDAAAVAVQSDGKIVVAGTSRSPSVSQDITVVRFAGDGSLDAAFADEGVSHISFGGVSRASDVVVQPDGKILVCGQVGFASHEWALARLNPDGSLDTEFGTDGLVTTDFGSEHTQTYNDSASALALQADGKIVVVGGVYPDSPARPYFAAARYLADGTRDADFGNDGLVITDFEADTLNALDRPTSVAIQNDGRIVVAGWTRTDLFDRSYDFGVVRYLPDGSLDPEFGGDGRIKLDFEQDIDECSAVSVLDDGEVLAAGSARSSPNGDPAIRGFALARLLPGGSLDPAFGATGSGQVIDQLTMSDDFAVSMVVQPDKKIVVAGYLREPDGVGFDVAVARFNEDGNIDTEFGVGGFVTTDVDNTNDSAADVALQDDGRIVVVGSTNDGFGGDMLVIRYFGWVPPAEATNSLGERVRELVASGDLGQNDGDFLLRALDRTVAQIQMGNATPAVNQLRTFIRRLELLVDRGELVPEVGQELIDAAQAIIADLTAS